MADEIKETDDIKEELETPEIEPDGKPDEGDKLEIDTKDVPDSSGNKPDDKAGVVRRIMEKLPSFGGKKETEEDTDNADPTGEGSDIPDEFTKAALDNGWTKEDIQDFAVGQTNETLKETIPFLFEEDDETEQEDETPANDSATQNTDLSPEKKELVKSIKDEVRKEFESELKELKEKAKAQDEQTKVERQQVLMNNVDKAFDEAGKDFDIFGETKKLPVFPAGPRKGQFVPTSPQMKARSEVYAKALPFIQNGVPVQEAMEIALTWYKGQNLESTIKRNLIKDLKKSEKKLSAKRTSKETVPTYEDEEDYKRKFILREAEKRGMKIVDE